MEQQNSKKPLNGEEVGRQDFLPPLGSGTDLTNYEVNVSPRRLSDRGRPTYWRHILPFAIFLLVPITFMEAIGGGLVYWDDNVLIQNFHPYYELSGQNIVWMFTTFEMGHYQPLTWLSFALDDYFFDRANEYYHLTSVLLHGLAALAFYFTARLLLVAGFAPDEFSSRRNDLFVMGAGVAALVFALHPLRVESVAWLAERRDVLSGLFFLISLWAYLRYVTAQRINAIFYMTAVLACLLSLLSKATAVTMFAVLIVLDVYPLRRFAREKSVFHPLIDKIPFLLMAIVGAVLALQAQAYAGALHSLEEYGMLSRIAQACYGLTFYIVKTVWPTNLSPIYEIPAPSVLLGRMLWLSLLGCVILIGIGIKYRKKFPAIPAALLIYAILLSPVLGFFQSGRQLVADRYSYLSCGGLAILLGAGLIMLLKTQWFGDRKNRFALLTVSSAVMIVALAHASYGQSRVWVSRLDLWQYAVTVSPQSSIAHTNYADALAEMAFGMRTLDLELSAEASQVAHQHYLAALNLNPNDPITWHHLGKLLYTGGDLRAARYAYLQALRRDPNRRGAHLDFARILIRLGETETGIKVLRDGMERTPGELELIGFAADVLATHPEEIYRKPEEALDLISRLNEAVGGMNAWILMIKSSTEASVGRFENATATANKALAIAESANNRRLATRIERRLSYYVKNEPYIMHIEMIVPAEFGEDDKH